MTALTAGLFLVAASAPSAGRIEAHVWNLRSDAGSVQCALFDKADGFPGKAKEKARKLATAAIKERAATCSFEGLSPGAYAIVVFHDENGNGTLDTNFVGIPKEGLGASNDARARFGPPKFDDARFSYTGGQLPLRIKVAY